MRKELESLLGYTFGNKELLEQALTHASASKSKMSYERLEFLGDRVLSFVVADMLYNAFPNEEEGALAKRHSALVKQDCLESVAAELKIGSHIRISEKNPSGSMQADVVESLIAALYLDGGFDVAESFIRRYWQPFLNMDILPPQDSKSALQEWAQARGLPLPEYSILERSGPDHRPSFVVQVCLQGYPSQQAPGASKQIAEKLAAQLLLNNLRENHDGK